MVAIAVIINFSFPLLLCYGLLGSSYLFNFIFKKRERPFIYAYLFVSSSHHHHRPCHYRRHGSTVLLIHRYRHHHRMIQPSPDLSLWGGKRRDEKHKGRNINFSYFS